MGEYHGMKPRTQKHIRFANICALIPIPVVPIYLWLAVTWKMGIAFVILFATTILALGVIF